MGTAGQAEINYKFNTLLAAADDLMLFKYIVKNVAWRNGKTATFMPKPIFGDNGSGMHVHQSLWQGGSPLFYDEQAYAGLSDTARYYIGGILRHAPSLLAFTNPTVNSYHRLVPGFEREVNPVYWQRNRSAAMRIPITGSNPKASVSNSAPRTPPATRTWPSPRSCSRAWTASRTRSSRPSRSTRTSTSWPPRSTRASPRSRPPSRPSSTRSSPTTSSSLQGGVFTSDLIETWIDYKRTNEIAPLQLRPHPHEFELYFDV
ncbi:Glutamine synthetase OS=Streptomyces antimycoticus OX=68175 GN=glnA PE=3 SV=1 [Streptomyces antimycoticus]